MRVLKNKQINQISHFKHETDDDSSLPFIPPHPLPKRGFMILSGAPVSGKTSLLTSLLCSNPSCYCFCQWVLLAEESGESTANQYATAAQVSFLITHPVQLSATIGQRLKKC